GTEVLSAEISECRRNRTVLRKVDRHRDADEVIEVFLGISVFLAPGFLAPQHAVVALQRDVEHLSLLDWPLKQLVAGRYTAGPTQGDKGFECFRQCCQDDLTSEREIWINQSFR